MNEHPYFEEDFELYALGTLEAEEKAALEAHLGACAECRERIEAARGRVALLALAAPPAAPPQPARERLLREFGAEHARRLASTAEGARRRRQAWAPLWAVAWLVLLAAAAWLALENHRLFRDLAELERTGQQQRAAQEALEAQSARSRAALDVLTAPETLQIELLPASSRPIPHGKAFYNPSKGLLFYAADLPPLPRNRAYQLWLVPSQGQPVSAGLFNTDARGNGQLILPSLPPGLAAKAFAVTVEPAGGVPQPTGPKVLIGLAS